MQKKAIITIIIVAIIAVILFGGVFAWQYFTAKSEAQNPKSETNLNSQNPNIQNETVGPVLSEAEGWRIYKDSQNGFEFRYPVMQSEFFKLNGLEVLSGALQTTNDDCFIKNEKYPDTAIARDKNVLVGGAKFCLSFTGDSGNGWSNPTYFYSTKIGENYLVIAMKFDVATCIAIKDAEKSQACLEYFKTPKNPPDIAQEIISTFKFTPVK